MSRHKNRRRPVNFALASTSISAASMPASPSRRRTNSLFPLAPFIPMLFHSLTQRFAVLVFSLGLAQAAETEVLPRLAYNNPGTLADLGVGLWAWPLPMD